jgi:hypothetical protein
VNRDLEEPLLERPLHLENRISWSRGIDSTTSTAFDDVQQMSVSAFTSAVVLT